MGISYFAKDCVVLRGVGGGGARGGGLVASGAGRLLLPPEFEEPATAFILLMVAIMMDQVLGHWLRVRAWLEARSHNLLKD
jgi:hypothetical protein